MKWLMHEKDPWTYEEERRTRCSRAYAGRASSFRMARDLKLDRWSPGPSWKYLWKANSGILQQETCLGVWESIFQEFWYSACNGEWKVVIEVVWYHPKYEVHYAWYIVGLPHRRSRDRSGFYTMLPSMFSVKSNWLYKRRVIVLRWLCL